MERFFTIYWGNGSSDLDKAIGLDEHRDRTWSQVRSGQAAGGGVLLTHNQSLGSNDVYRH